MRAWGGGGGGGGGCGGGGWKGGGGGGGGYSGGFGGGKACAAGKGGGGGGCQAWGGPPKGGGGGVPKGKGKDSKGAAAAATGAPSPGGGKSQAKGVAGGVARVRLNPADREEGLALQGISGTPARERAKRKAGSTMQWVGVRANAGVVNSGRWAFCVWNETGGNLRIGWSAGSASLKLGTDKYSYGYGGTATKSNAGQFTKYGQTYGQGDAVTCCVDLDRNAILFYKNGREIPGGAFDLGKDMVGWPLFPHVYTKEAAFSVSFDGGGGAPPLTGGFQWIANAGKCLVASALKSDDEEVQEDADDGKGGSNFVLTSFGWRTADEAKVPAASQEWRKSLDAYVKHFTSLLELEYVAERDAVVDRVKRKSPQQIQSDGVGVVGLSAEFDSESGRITLWMDRGQFPYLSEISRGRTVLISTVHGSVDVDDATKTISGEVESIRHGTLVVHTSYERLPTGVGGPRRGMQYRADLGPNLVAYKRIDKFLDELQRSLGTAQASKSSRMHAIEKLNANHNLSGLLLPGTPFSSALYDDITESSQAAIKWDPLQRPKPNPEADISKAARERDIGAAPYAPKGPPPPTSVSDRLNSSQKEATRFVLELRRRFSLIQGPPGTGKTTTAVATICGWLRTRRGPVLATAFSNRGVDNMAEALHKLGVRVLRVGLCPADSPYSLETRLAECGERRGDKGMAAVLGRMDVVAATCIGVGMGPLDKHVFPFVVVDEAAQVIEPAVVLPLGKGAVQAVMVGDQCQLPATVLSQEAQRRGLDVSMFDRLLSMGMEYQMLKQQYRMHPKIAAFPSWRFYRSELSSAVTEASRQLPARLQLRSPLVFLHVDAMEQAGGSSKKNPTEASCVAWLVEAVLRSMPATLTGEEIGIITPYGAQVREISRQLPQAVKHFIQVSTVDAFQGCEKQVILLSLVRANARGDVGFVADWRRLNVALTRSKVMCVLVGHLPTWLAADSGLLRDWLGYNPESAANVFSFQGGALHHLPPYLAKSVGDLRAEHLRMRPQAAPLPRVTQEARGGSGGSSRAKLMMLDAARALAEALSSEDAEALSSALSQARQTGVDQVRIDEGETVLRRLVAAHGLELAVQSGEEASIVAAIAEARTVGLDQKKIREAEEAMRQTAAAQALEAAVAAEDEAQLKKALVNAKSAGLQARALHQGEQKLKGWGAVREAARELTAAIASKKDAALQKALEKAREAGVATNLIEEGEQALMQAVTEGAAEKELKAALVKRDEVMIEQAIAKAREAGARVIAIKEAERVLNRLALTRELADAMGGGDEASLQAALPRAREAGVEASVLDRASKALKQMAAASKALREACAGGDAAAVSDALRVGRAAGLGVASLAPAEARLRELTASGAEGVALAAARELNTARELVTALELAGSVHEEDTASLRNALAEAIVAGVDEAALQAAQDVLDRVFVDGSAGAPAPAASSAALAQGKKAFNPDGAPASKGGDKPFNPYAGAAPRGGKGGGDRFFGDVQSGKAEAPAAGSEEPFNPYAGAAARGGKGGGDRFFGDAQSGQAEAPGTGSDQSQAKRRRVEETPGEGSGSSADAGRKPVLQRWGAKRRKAQEGRPSEGGEPAADEDERALAVCRLEAAVLVCRKRQAIEEEDFDLAQDIKKYEANVAARAARLQASASPHGGGAAAATSGVSGAGAIAAQLEKLRAEKRAAAEAEDFGRAAELKKQEEELLQAQAGAGGGGGDDPRGIDTALAMLESSSPEALLAACGAEAASCAASAGPGLWQQVAAQLRASWLT